MKTKLITLSFLLLFSTNTFAQDTGLTNYVDPRIGSEGLGRVFIGPKYTLAEQVAAPNTETSL